jgi:fumarate hydratase, class II
LVALENLAGSQSALPIWTEFMKRSSGMSLYNSPLPFNRPNGIETATIDNLTKLAAAADPILTHSEVFIRIEDALKGVYRLALGGTAVGTGINAAPGFGEAAANEIAKLTSIPFVSAPNKFTMQGAHDALVQLSGTLRTLAVSLYKIANDIRLMSCGPRAGFAELVIPANEPGSSIMPGKVNPTQAEALSMIAVQVMANDVAVGFGGAGGYLEMNVYKPLIIFNITHSITLMTDGCTNFRKFLVEGTKPNVKKIKEYVDRSLMLVTALSPVIGYDRASKIAHYALDNDLTLKQAALKLGFVTEDEFDRIVDPAKMVKPYIAAAQ